MIRRMWAWICDEGALWFSIIGVIAMFAFALVVLTNGTAY